MSKLKIILIIWILLLFFVFFRVLSFPNYLLREDITWQFGNSYRRSFDVPATSRITIEFELISGNAEFLITGIDDYHDSNPILLNESNSKEIVIIKNDSGNTFSCSLRSIGDNDYYIKIHLLIERDMTLEKNIFLATVFILGLTLTILTVKNELNEESDESLRLKVRYVGIITFTLGLIFFILYLMNVFLVLIGIITIIIGGILLLTSIRIQKK
jgi:hypothetical protein